ncbi:LysR family transcriptional regulator [Paraburkholderia phytofirmans OLGA172]|jgi:DNA-binding transcriptional LysR family regulator|uniref:LysR family transcriptional regulator n=1 Tax=Paraburkholderia phytofirmans OLGA172 TaxID=1417228 RepID=A0A160FMJ0_9BURK|nr:LysR substrate-binding domain-containing protein [Paraburkholderia phytofirmans]ANB73654.1 LysR family transcriptional regulator [Paraburkholderia phytofirmans OLGA172]
MKLRQIEAFRAVMQAGSTTAAALELHTSQSNVSRLISQLESDTRLVLFERTGGRLIPKPEAKAFFREVERAFVGLKSLTYAADSIRNLGSGRLRIASIPGIGLSFLPRVVQRFKRSRPDVTVSVHTNTSNTVEQWVSSQFCDVGIVAFVSASATCQVLTLPDVEVVCIVPKGHRLAKRTKIAASDLQGEQYISLVHGDGSREDTDRLFEREGVERLLSLEAQYSATCCEMVKLGLGVTLAHPLVATDFVGQGVKVLPFSPSIHYPNYLLYPPHGAVSQLAEEFAALLRDQFEREIVGWKK